MVHALYLYRPVITHWVMWSTFTSHDHFLVPNEVLSTCEPRSVFQISLDGKTSPLPLGRHAWVLATLLLWSIYYYLKIFYFADNHFIAYIFLICAPQLLTSNAVHKWGIEIQEGIFNMLGLLIELVVASLKQDTLNPVLMDCLKLVSFIMLSVIVTLYMELPLDIL